MFVAYEEKLDGLVVRVAPDESDCNPRKEFDNVATMICAHRRYVLGDVQVNYPISEDEIREEYGPLLAIRPLYLYDHSGLRVSITPFSCPWDSGQIGWVFVTAAKGREEWPDGFKPYSTTPTLHTPTIEAWAERLIEGEVAEYNMYLSGDVWGYQLLDESGEELDSLWRMFGLEYAQGEAKAALESMAKQRNEHASPV